MTKNLIIFRGVPNAGKTTLSSLLVPGGTYSADDYFTDDKGIYRFDAARIKDAHEYCQNCVRIAMNAGQRVVAVANTFTQEWEMKPYFEMAEMFGYRVSTVIVERRHSGQNDHNVPDDAVMKMRERFEVKL